MFQLSTPTKVFLIVAAIVALGLLLFRSRGERVDPETKLVRKHQRKGDVEALAKLAQEGKGGIPTKAVKAMGYMGDPGRDALVLLLDDSGQKTEVRAKAALALNRCIPKGAAERGEAERTLAKAAKSDPDPKVRASAVTTLGHARAYRDLDTLCDALMDRDVAVRRQAATAIHKIIRVDFGYSATAPAKKREAIAKTIRAFCNDPQRRRTIEAYYKGRFKKIHERFGR